MCMLLWLRYEPKMRIPPEIRIASHITKFGHDVAWISSSEGIRDVEETNLNDVCVSVLPCRYNEGFTKIISKASYAFRRMRFVFKNFKNGEYNLIFVEGDLFDAFLALCVRKRYGIPFVFQMINPIEQIWETDKVYSRHKCICYLLSKIRHPLTLYALRRADMILPISRWLEDDLVRKGIDRSKITPLPEGVDPGRFLNRTGVAVRAKYGLGDFKIMIYVGTMDKMRHLDVLIHAFSKVRGSRGDVKLLMVGDGTGKSDLEKLADELGIRGDVIFTGYVYFGEVPDFIAAANLGLSAVPPLDFYKVSSPIKMLEYMAMAKPVVANEEIPDQKEVMGASRGGILVRFDSESFADGIIKLLDNPDLAEEMGRRGRDWVVENRSYDMIASELEKGCFEVLER